MNNSTTNQDAVNEWDYNPREDGAIAIPVRIGQRPDVPADEDDALVREYEERYYGPRHNYQDVEPPHKAKNDWSNPWDSVKNTKLPPRHRYQPRPAPSSLSDEERIWAALAHGSALISLIALFSGVFPVILTVLIPLGIYLMYRKRSEYVAFHALQAFTIQTVCTIGVVAVATIGTILLGIMIFISAIFSIFLIGIPFLLLFLGLLLMLWLVALLTPFAMLVYGMIATYAAWNGRNYRYPYVADWVDDQLLNGRRRRSEYV